ncbi:MAG: tyrosine-type recombinase/integrase [Nitrospira sp.]
MKRPTRPPWNKRVAVGQMTPLTAANAAVIRSKLIAERKIRDLALFNMALDTMLRASDLLPLRVRQITDHRGRVIEEFPIRQRKTARTHVVALSRETCDSLAAWIALSRKGPGAYLWTSIGNRRTGSFLTREQYANLVKRWVSYADLNWKRYSTHSMRRSKSVAIYQATKDLAACQHLLGHKNIGSTAYYLGMDQRKALSLARKIRI